MIELTNILDQREDDHLEAKGAKGGFPDSFWDSYSAFANSDGGMILHGVEERSDHTLYMQVGLADSENMKVLSGNGVELSGNNDSNLPITEAFAGCTVLRNNQTMIWQSSELARLNTAK